MIRNRSEKEVEDLLMIGLSPSCFGQLIDMHSFDEERHHAGAILLDTSNIVKQANDKKKEGNDQFKANNLHVAEQLYTEALELLPIGFDFDPQRAIFFSNRAACYNHMGRYEEVVEDCTQAIKYDMTYTKAYMRRSNAYEGMEKEEDALRDINTLLSIDPKYGGAQIVKERLDKVVKEKQEKMKEEMIGKMKDLGNTILGKFGMSLDNFQMKQDPSTGSYSVNFKS